LINGKITPRWSRLSINLARQESSLTLSPRFQANRIGTKINNENFITVQNRMLGQSRGACTYLSLSEADDLMGLWWRGEEWTPDGEYWKKGAGGILSSMAPIRKTNPKENSTRLRSFEATKSPGSQEIKKTEKQKSWAVMEANECGGGLDGIQ
jgi:hypothetical protein